MKSGSTPHSSSSPGRPGCSSRASGASVARVLEDAAERVAQSGDPSSRSSTSTPCRRPTARTRPVYVTLAGVPLSSASSGCFELVANAKGPLTPRVARRRLAPRRARRAPVDACNWSDHRRAARALRRARGGTQCGGSAVAALFASTMVVLIGRWAILPTFTLFVTSGTCSSGGAVAPPLLPSSLRARRPDSGPRRDRRDDPHGGVFPLRPALGADPRHDDLADMHACRLAGLNETARPRTCALS